MAPVSFCQTCPSSPHQARHLFHHLSRLPYKLILLVFLHQTLPIYPAIGGSLSLHQQPHTPSPPKHLLTCLAYFPQRDPMHNPRPTIPSYPLCTSPLEVNPCPISFQSHVTGPAAKSHPLHCRPVHPLMEQSQRCTRYSGGFYEFE